MNKGNCSFVRNADRTTKPAFCFFVVSVSLWLFSNWLIINALVLWRRKKWCNYPFHKRCNCLIINKEWIKRFFFVYTDKFVYYCGFREIALPWWHGANPSVSYYGTTSDVLILDDCFHHSGTYLYCDYHCCHSKDSSDKEAKRCHKGSGQGSGWESATS